MNIAGSSRIRATEDDRSSKQPLVGHYQAHSYHQNDGGSPGTSVTKPAQYMVECNKT